MHSRGLLRLRLVCFPGIVPASARACRLPIRHLRIPAVFIEIRTLEIRALCRHFPRVPAGTVLRCPGSGLMTLSGNIEVLSVFSGLFGRRGSSSRFGGLLRYVLHIKIILRCRLLRDIAGDIRIQETVTRSGSACPAGPLCLLFLALKLP